MRTVGPWIDIKGGAYRALAGKDGDVIANRVAFVEKSPRVRIRGGTFHAHDDSLNWAHGPMKGEGPEDADCRQWCDDMLRMLGYDFEADVSGEDAAFDKLEPAVTIKLATHEQAYAVRDALDLYSRLGMGQLGILAELVQHEKIPLGPNHKHKDVQESSESVSDFMERAKSHLGYPGSFYWGISHPVVPQAAKRAYEVERVLTKALATARNPSPVFRGTDHDGLLVRYTCDPAPAVRAARRHSKE